MTRKINQSGFTSGTILVTLAGLVLLGVVALTTYTVPRNTLENVGYQNSYQINE